MLEWLTYLYDAFNPQSHVQGSIADLDLSSIPRSREVTHVMKLCVQDALYDLRPSRWDFLTNVLRLTNLLFTFDKSSALSCIHKTYFTRHARMSHRFIYPDGEYVVADIVKFFDGTHYDCISAGSKFLKCVTEFMIISCTELVAVMSSGLCSGWICLCSAIVWKS